MAGTDEFTVDDFTDFLRWLDDEGIPFVVIGGCAVGAYARVRGQTVISADLDLYTTPQGLNDMVSRAPEVGAAVKKLPQPRSVLVAVLEWQGKEINVLCSSAALPPPETTMRMAHEIEIPSAHLTVPIADPIDLLADKLALGRPKDAEHVEILKQYIEAELELRFAAETPPRQRHASIRRYLAALGTDELPEPLACRLAVHTRAESDLRFLAGRCRSRSLLDALCEKAGDEDLRKLLRELHARSFGA